MVDDELEQIREALVDAAALAPACASAATAAARPSGARRQDRPVNERAMINIGSDRAPREFGILSRQALLAVCGRVERDDPVEPHVLRVVASAAGGRFKDGLA